MNINSAVITGRLTRDPELRATPSGHSVVELGIAVNSREKVGGEWQDRADFVDVTAWGKTAENAAQYLAKGREVAVDGYLRLDRWENADGEKRSKLKIVARNVQFLSDGQGRAQAAQSDAPGDTSDFDRQPQEPVAATPDDDIPF